MCVNLTSTGTLSLTRYEQNQGQHFKCHHLFGHIVTDVVTLKSNPHQCSALEE